MVKAYLLDNQDRSYSTDDLAKIGVLYFSLNPSSYENDGSLDKIMNERNYGHKSIVTINDTLPNFDQMLVKFFDEHIHLHEEIRFFLDGCGFFDVRNEKDEWVRIYLEAGDLIIVPAGLFHRFKLHDNMYAKVMRLFLKDTEPVWTAYTKSLPETSKMEAHLQYNEFIKKQFSL